MSRSKKAGTQALSCKKTVLVKMVALCAVLVVFATGCVQIQEERPPIKEEVLNPVDANYKTVKVQKGGYIKTKTGSANVVYMLQSELRWEKENAYFQEALVTAGQEVKEGDVLMRFDREQDPIEVESLKRNIQRKKETITAENTRRSAAITEAQTGVDTLLEQGAGHFELEIAKLEVQKLQIEYEQFLYTSGKELAQLEEQMAEIEQAAQENVLLAPYDGVIDSVKAINPGERVTSGQVLITMHANDKLFLKPDRSAGDLRYNMDIVINIGNKENPSVYSGRVIAAPNILPESVKQDMVLIQVNEKVPENELKKIIKYQGTVEQLQDILIADQSAVQIEEGRYFVKILDGKNVMKRCVSVIRVNNESVWILDGLSEGQLLIVD